MNPESNMTAALIDPQLQLMDQGTAIQGMQFQYPLPATTFEPWNSMFESIGEFPPSAQAMDMMDSDLHSDESSSLSFSLGTEQDMQFPLSPLVNAAIVEESPGNTSISTGPSEAGTSADKKTTKAATATGTATATATTSPPKVRRPRRRRTEAEKREQVKLRNRVAASKCRQKKKEKVDELKEIKQSLEARNHELHVEYQRLRQEVGHIKSHLIHHTDCNDPNINRWVENEAKGFVQRLVRKDEEEQQQRMGSISSTDGFADAMRMTSIHEARDPYMGLG